MVEIKVNLKFYLGYVRIKKKRKKIVINIYVINFIVLNLIWLKIKFILKLLFLK